MRRFVVLAAALLLARPQRAAAEIGPGVVWEPTAAVLARFRAECRDEPAPDVRQCLLGFMARAGASPEALEFSRRLDGEGWTSRFQAGVRVGAAFVHYPFRANANDGVLLVGGTPEVVDVSSAAALAPLEEDARLAALRGDHHDASLWASDPGVPAIEDRPGGGQRFSFEFPLRDCHACADLAVARVAYDFDADGRFLGPRLLTVAAPPAFSVAGEVVRGKGFEAPVDGARVLRLKPFSEGWTIEVEDKDGRDYCAAVTPPYRGTNALTIFGGDFRNADNTGPSAGRETRRFRCSATGADAAAASRALGTVLWSDKASWKEVDAASEDHRRLVAAAQRGRLTITRLELGNLVKGGRPWIEAMAFRFELFAPGVEER